MRRRIKQRLMAVILCLGFTFGLFDGIPFVKENMSGTTVVEALCTNGIQGNGLGGINININSGYYASYANMDYGQYAYTKSGCAWFASARVRELTGRGSAIYGGNNWYNNQAGNLGFTKGATLRAKAVACWSNHVAIVEAISGNTVYISEGGYTGGTVANGYTVIRTVSSSYFSSGSQGTWLGFVYLGIDGTVAPVDNIPQGCVDYVTCTEPGKIVVRGWAFDRDNVGVSLAIHVYIGGEDEGHAIIANKSRNDVNVAYPGVGNNHGFESVIETKKSGSQTVTIFAINIRQDGNQLGYANPVIGKQTIHITADTTKPTVSNIRVSGVTRGYYTVTATATDNKGVTEVRFATWTSKNGQDDLKWISGTKINSTTWQCQILASDHNMESGGYITHVYAYDAAGNSMGLAAPVIQIPDVTENINTNVGVEFEAYIVNSSTNNYLYQSEKNVIDATHWDLLSGEYNRKSLEREERETWIFSRQSDGYYTIQNKNSGKYLDIANASKNSGTNVILSELNINGGSDNQKFQFYKSSKGYFITSKCTPYTVLDIRSSSSGTSVYANYYDPVNTNQIFKIVRCDEDSSYLGEDSGNEKNVNLVSKNNADKKVSVIPYNAEKPDKVIILSLKNGTSKIITAKWKKVSGAKGYQIQYALSKKKLNKGERNYVKKTSVTIKKLKKKKTYYVRVRAYKQSGKKKVYGNWSKVRKIKIKK